MPIVRTAAIRAFEPRLLNPVVHVAAHPDRPTTVRIDVSGSIRPGDYVEDVWFPIHISSKAFGHPQGVNQAPSGPAR